MGYTGPPTADSEAARVGGTVPKVLTYVAKYAPRATLEPIFELR